MGHAQRFANFVVLISFILPPSAMAQTPNQLTAGETAEGWVLLFDGTSLNGWAPRLDGRWEVADGTISAVADAGRGFMVTTAHHANFQLRIDFWIDDTANSGVFLRCPAEGAISQGNAFEVNIFDPHETWPTGSINEVAKIQTVPQTAGHWNTFEITADGDHPRRPAQRSDHRRCAVGSTSKRAHRVAIQRVGAGAVSEHQAQDDRVSPGRWDDGGVSREESPMRLRILPVSFLALVCLVGTASPRAAACDPEGDVQFLCGPVSPEDLIAVPQSPWVIVSGMEDDGYLYVADTRDHTSTVLYPTESSRPEHDTATYGSCPGPASSQFRPHGLSLRPGNDGVHTLYVVRHGGREAIEVFTVDASDTSPSVTWVGCVMAPESVGLQFRGRASRRGFCGDEHFDAPLASCGNGSRLRAGRKVPGSETSGPNGLVVSADGRWFFIGGWGTESLIRLSRGQTPVQKDEVAVGFHIDNVRWTPDGSLLAAGHAGSADAVIGQCLGQGVCDGVSSRVARVDPEGLTTQEIIRYPSNDYLILGTVAIQVGEEIWVGGIGGSDRIARFAAP